MENEVIVIREALSGDFNLGECSSLAALQERLAVEIDHLIQADFHRLIAFLYRLDISERKLKQSLEENTDQDAGTLIAGLVMERQLEKFRTRQQFKSQEDIPEEDRW